jgi:hypothetical protein
MTMMDDLVNRSPDIHWPQGFDPTQADLFSHNELLINATCERVWQHIIDATKWPDWYPNSKGVHIVGDGFAHLTKPQGLAHQREKPKVLARLRNNYDRPSYHGNALGYAEDIRNGPQRLFSNW